MICNEKEILDYLNIPSVPKKKWDGKSSFKHGVAITTLVGGDDAYAVASFDEEFDDAPRIVKAFTQELFTSIGDIFVVPNYMDLDVENMDLDDDSKVFANAIVEEAKELETSDLQSEPKKANNANEYFFNSINSDEEAVAFIKAYNKKHRIRGRIPKTHDALLMKLYVMWDEQNGKKK